MARTSPFRALLVVAVALAALFMLAPSASAAQRSVPDEGTVQADGQINAVLAVGDRLYLGGTFTHVNGVQRDRLAAIDATTGKLTDWAPKANGPVMALAASSSGGRIYVGGSFTEVSGTKRGHLAALNSTTGKVNKTWRPKTDYAVYALAVSGKRVYLGGSFTDVNGKSQPRLAQVNSDTGELNSRWVPKVQDGTVHALALSSDGSRLYAGGNFTAINDKSVPYLATLNATSRGRLYETWHTPTPNGMVWDLAVSGTRVYTAEGGPGGAVAAYDGDTGARAWRLWADGDAQSIAILGGKVYFGGHFAQVGGDLGVLEGRTSRDALAAADVATGELDQWAPSGTDGQVWAMKSDVSRPRLYVGGTFTTISGQPHQGFAQFSE